MTSGARGRAFLSKKHIILIHGRSTKPSEDVKADFVERALVGRLESVNAPAAGRISSGEIQVSVAYYGDILNRILIENDPGLPQKHSMQKVDGIWFERRETYDADFGLLLKRSDHEHKRVHYKNLLSKSGSRPWQDNLARIASKALSLLGISKWLILRTCPDLKAYLRSRIVGSSIRECLMPVIKEALAAGANQ